MDTKKAFDETKGEGWINLICGALMFVGAIGIFFYFISGCRPKDIPANLHPIVEETSEVLIEAVLGLEPGTVEIDLTPGEDTKEEEKEK